MGDRPERVSVSLDRWLKSDGEKTLGSLITLFEEKSFAILFVLLLGVPALPLPTGGATHVFEVIAVLLALQLTAGRDRIWLPQRWCKLELAGGRRERFITGLMKWIRRVLRPGGELALTTPAHSRLTGLRVLAGGFEAVFDPLSPHLRFFTRRSLGRLLDELGFDVVSLRRRRGTLLVRAQR